MGATLAVAHRHQLKGKTRQQPACCEMIEKKSTHHLTGASYGQYSTGGTRLDHDCTGGVGVIFLRGGDGAKDGQKLVGGEQWKQWSKKQTGKQEVGVEDGKSWTEQENPGAAGAG